MYRIKMGLEGHVRRDQLHLYDQNDISGTVKAKENDDYFDDLNITMTMTKLMIIGLRS